MHKPRKSLTRWDEALKHAKEAFDKLRNAEGMRQGQLPDDANPTVEEAMKALKLRYEISTTLLTVIVTYCMF